MRRDPQTTQWPWHRCTVSMYPPCQVVSTAVCNGDYCLVRTDWTLRTTVPKFCSLRAILQDSTLCTWYISAVNCRLPHSIPRRIRSGTLHRLLKHMATLHVLPLRVSARALGMTSINNVIIIPRRVRWRHASFGLSKEELGTGFA